MTAHLVELGIVGTNLMLAHVTWRTLPDEHRHSVRRMAGKVTAVRIPLPRIAFGRRRQPDRPPF